MDATCTWLPYSVRAFMVSPTWRAYLSCSISRGLRYPFSRAWGMGLPYMSSNALNLSLGADCMWSTQMLDHYRFVGIPGAQTWKLFLLVMP